MGRCQKQFMEHHRDIIPQITVAKSSVMQTSF